MNNKRRNSINKIIDSINKIKDELFNIRCDLSEIQDEEEEAYNNLPEPIQNGERGQAAQEVIDALDEAYTAIMDDQMIDLDEAIYKLEQAAQ